jgi:hypothetical protein
MSVFMGEVDEQCECIRDHASEKSDWKREEDKDEGKWFF